MGLGQDERQLGKLRRLQAEEAQVEPPPRAKAHRAEEQHHRQQQHRAPVSDHGPPRDGVVIHAAQAPPPRRSRAHTRRSAGTSSGYTTAPAGRFADHRGAIDERRPEQHQPEQRSQLQPVNPGLAFVEVGVKHGSQFGSWPAFDAGFPRGRRSLDGRVNLLHDRRAGAAAGTAAFDHGHDGVARLLVRREGDEPGDVVRPARLARSSPGRCRSCRKCRMPGHGGPDARAVGIFHVGQHRIAQDFQVARVHAQFIPHLAAREVIASAPPRVASSGSMRSTRRGRRTLPPLAMAAVTTAIWMRRHGHLALADAQIAGVAVEPAGR